MGIYFLGIDGGGTKTELVLTDSKRNPLRTLRVEGCNPMDIGMEECKKILRKAIRQICEGIPYSSVAMFAGIAGGGTPEKRNLLSEFFKEFQFCCYANDSDNLSIIAAGLGKKDGVILIMGTGICALTQKKGSLNHTAGWGYLIDEGGSGYNIGRDGLSAYYQAKDGTGSSTMLSELISQESQCTADNLLQRIYEGKKKTIASFATVVYRAAELGDVIAQEIIERNMCFAAKVIQTASAPLRGNESIPVVLAGGLTRAKLTDTYLRKAIGENQQYHIQVLEEKPVNGAVMLAAELYEKELEK